MYAVLMILMLLIPAAAGIAEACMKRASKTAQDALFVSALAAETLLYAMLLFLPVNSGFRLFSMTEVLTIKFRLDGFSLLFLALVTAGFLLSGIFATAYMDHSSNRSSFYAFMLLSQFALVGMDNAANLITMYMFFEMATLLSIPLVLHDRTPEAISASMKYLFYSIAGALLGLLFIFVASHYSDTLDFIRGGSLNLSAVSGHETLLLVVSLLGVIGFGAKAGMYPLHGWLPDAHPVAPAPASAVLSGVITKAGVLAILRLIYFVVGPDFLRGTWVQTVLLSLALLTVFMGSMMAYRQDVLKKRLAYSSVSQISYVLTGLFLLTEQGVQGGLLQVLFHACVKICLFLCAGSMIFHTGKTKVSEFLGIGKTMPVTLWSFTIASLSLIGIPPAAGFVSKWYLAAGALDSALPVMNWLVPVVLLVSALLTAAYLLPVTIRGFFPGKDFAASAERSDGIPEFWLPLVILAGMSLLLGIFGGTVTEWAASLASLVM